jgi:hypothetical protein
VIAVADQRASEAGLFDAMLLTVFSVQYRSPKIGSVINQQLINLSGRRCAVSISYFSEGFF